MKIKLGKYPARSSRKVDIKIDKEDTWGLDTTLSLIILPCLLQLKDTKKGVPAEFAEVGGEDYGYQLSFDFYKETYSESFDKKALEWEEVLDKMIWSFSQIAFDKYSDKYHHGDPKFEWEPLKHKIMNPITGKLEKVYQMIDTNPNEHWYDREGHMLHEERIQEGLTLFGKYFRDLWD